MSRQVYSEPGPTHCGGGYCTIHHTATHSTFVRLRSVTRPRAVSSGISSALDRVTDAVRLALAELRASRPSPLA